VAPGARPLVRGGIERGGIDQGGIERGGIDQGGVDQGGIERVARPMARDSGSLTAVTFAAKNVTISRGYAAQAPRPPAEVAPALFFSNNPVKIPTE